MDKKKVKLIINNIENSLKLLKLELNETEETEQPNTISIADFVKGSNVDLPEPDYYEEDDVEANDILLNSKDEQEFYARFKLGD